MSLIDNSGVHALIGTDALDIVRKFNPYHGKGGLFSSGKGGGSGIHGGSQPTESERHSMLAAERGRQQREEAKFGQDRGTKLANYGVMHGFKVEPAHKEAVANMSKAGFDRYAKARAKGKSHEAAMRAANGPAKKPGPIARSEAAFGRMNISPNMMSGGGLS